MRNLTTWKPSAFFRQLSIGFKLGSAMTLLILVSLSLSGFALWQFREQSQQARELESSWNFAFSARGLSQSVEHVVVVANNLVTSADKEELKGKLDLLANALNQLKAAYANFLANAGTRISEQQKTRMSLDITDFIAYQNDIVELGLKASPKAALLEANDETTIKNREKMISSIEKVSQSTLTKLAIEREANTARSRNIELSLIVFSATGIFLGIIASIFMIATQVRRPLRLITSLMQQVAQGNLTAEIPFVDKVDEIGKMAQALVVFKEALINQARPETLSVTTRAAAQAAQERNHAERLQAAEEGAIVVRLLGEKLRSLASGDLTVQLREDFPTAYLQIKSDFNEAVEKLKETIQLVALSVDAVQAGTQDIASASTDMVRQTDQQTSSLEETVAALDQIIITVRHSAEGTTLARQIAASADADAQNSSGVLRRTIDAMDSIAALSRETEQLLALIGQFQIVGHAVRNDRRVVNDRIFPTSYRAKLFFIAFVGTHVPLVCMAIWAISASNGAAPPMTELWILLGATLIGSIGTLAGLWLALVPLDMSTECLEQYQKRRILPSLPTHYQDSAGQLMKSVSSLIHDVDGLISDAESQAITDPLTGLMNRRGFERKTGAQITIHASKWATAHVATFDLDHFKLLNDTFGHDKGDEVLRSFAEVLRRNIRQGDIVSRFGGEEFVIYFPNTDIVAAKVICERILKNTASIRVVQRKVTTSVGLASFAPTSASLDAVLKQADRALYLAKRNGRDQLAVASQRFVAADYIQF
eukprot:gene15166-15308_t